MLLLLEPGLIINTDLIQSITELPAVGSGRDRTEIIFTDGTRKIINHPVERLEWFTGTIIQAPSGYLVIQAWPPEKEGEATTFATFPVLAFRLTDDEPVPIIAFGSLGESWALIWPDGRCDEHWNRLWPSVEGYKASFGPRGERS